MDYINRPFDGETIELDRNTYTNCTFKNCTIVYRAEADLHLDRVTVSRSRWIIGGAARRTLRFLTMLYAHGGDVGRAVVEDTFEKIRSGALGKDESVIIH